MWAEEQWGVRARQELRDGSQREERGREDFLTKGTCRPSVQDMSDEKDTEELKAAQWVRNIALGIGLEAEQPIH